MAESYWNLQTILKNSQTFIKTFKVVTDFRGKKTKLTSLPLDVLWLLALGWYKYIEIMLYKVVAGTLMGGGLY